MGWMVSSRWRSRQDVLDYWKKMVEESGYSVKMSGSWAYCEQDGKPVDLIYVKTAGDKKEWGYKDMSVSSGPNENSAPLWMVLKIHTLFQDVKYYQAWFGDYPQKEKVLQHFQRLSTPSLFEEAV